MTPREHATLTAALRFWSERNVPRNGPAWALLMAELDLIASGGRQFPALDAEEIDRLIGIVSKATYSFSLDDLDAAWLEACFASREKDAITPSPVSSPEVSPVRKGAVKVE